MYFLLFQAIHDKVTKEKIQLLGPEDTAIEVFKYIFMLEPEPVKCLVDGSA